MGGWLVPVANIFLKAIVFYGMSNRIPSIFIPLLSAEEKEQEKDHCCVDLAVRVKQFRIVS